MNNHQTEILRSLGKAMGRMGLYSPTHPAVKSSVEEFHNVLGAFFMEGNEALILATAGQGLLFNGSLVEEPGAAMIGELLGKLTLESLTFEKGATVEEILALNALIYAKPEEIKSGVDRILEARGVAHIKANEARYVKEAEAGAHGNTTVQEGAVQTEQEIARAVISEIKGHSLDSMIMAMIKKVVKDEEAQRRIFEMIMEQVRGELEEKIKKATESIEKEKKIIENEKERTETVISSMSEGIVMVDAEGKIVMMNPAAEKMYGATLKELAGRKLDDIVGDDKMLTLSKDLTTGKADGMIKEVELRSSEDTCKTLRSSSAVVQNQDGKVVGMMAVLSDVTKQKELERQKSDFVANVTHELRTPLVTMMQAVNLILDKIAGDINAQQESLLTMAKRNMERLYGLVNDFLDMSKIEAGKMIIRPDAVETDKLIREVGQTMQPWADSKGVELVVDMPSAVPKIYADHDRIMQVFINLVNNAVKFTDKGGKVAVAVAGVKKAGNREQGTGNGEQGNSKQGTGGTKSDPRSQTPDPALLLISVSDTGKGMAKEDIPRIFNKFEQLGVKSPADIKGTGLGLSIVKSIVDLHGGEINVKSEVGKGSVFTVALPVYNPPQSPLNLRGEAKGGYSKRESKSFWQRMFGR